MGEQRRANGMGKSKASLKTRERSPSSLFQVDVGGDNSVRHSVQAEYSRAAAGGAGAAAAGQRLRKGESFNKRLKADEILANKSSTPAVSQRSHAGAGRDKVLDKATRDRLRRLTKRDGQGRGLWGVKSDKGKQEDPLTEAVRKAGAYDPWATSTTAAPAATAQPSTSSAEQDNFAAELLNKPKPKVPETLHKHELLGDTRTSTYLGPSTISLPDPGQSYNPSQESHQALLARALKRAERLEQKELDDKRVKEIVDRVREATRSKEAWEAFEEEVGDGELASESERERASSELDGEDDDDGGEKTKRDDGPRRKTRAQRNTAARQLHEARLREAMRQSKRRDHSVLLSKSLNKSLRADAEKRKMQASERRVMVEQALGAHGLASLRGQTRKPAGEDDPHVARTEDVYQLGDELRSLKPEGNLWRDWVASATRRGRLAAQNARSRRPASKKATGDSKRKLKTYEKFAWKNFDK